MLNCDEVSNQASLLSMYTCNRLMVIVSLLIIDFYTTVPNFNFQAISFDIA